MRRVILVGLLGSLFERLEPNVHFVIFECLKVKMYLVFLSSYLNSLNFYDKVVLLFKRVFPRITLFNVMLSKVQNSKLDASTSFKQTP
jgi:hypothetical protein